MSTPERNAQTLHPEVRTGLPDGENSLSPPSRIQFGFTSTEEQRRVLEWLGAGLRPSQSGRLPLEYPLLFARNASAIHCILFEDEHPAAFCTLWAVTFRIGVQRLRTGLISLVYTDPARRGTGCATRVVEAAMIEAERLDLGLLLLWSNLDRLYRPLGFEQAGRESLLVVGKDVLDRAIDAAGNGAHDDHTISIDEARPEDWSELERLRGFRTCQLELDPGELTRAGAIPDLSVRIARDASGIRGFAMRGRGDDFEEVIHEWGGDAQAALLCCRALVEDCVAWNELFLMSPPEREELPWLLRRAGARVVNQPLGWMRIASTSALSRDLEGLLPEGEAIEIEGAPPGGPNGRLYTVRSAQGTRVLEQGPLLEELFGSARRRAASPSDSPLEGLLGPNALSQLPIPFFVWGLESI